VIAIKPKIRNNIKGHLEPQQSSWMAIKADQKQLVMKMASVAFTY
jgi:hypothetical protein